MQAMDATHGEELRLVTAAQRGDGESFNALVRLYETRVYNLCLRMLGDAESAADATQDSFLSAYKNLRTFRGGSLRSWLLRIATNTCYDALRVRKRRPTTSIDAAFSDPDAPAFDLPDPQESPDDVALRRELGAEIQQALQTLPEDQRLIVVLSDIQGLAYEEIATITGTNLGTVKSRLSRGRARMRDFLRARELLPARYRLENDAEVKKAEI
jgi:RNA polymerase sigma-70 factor (ECF subfamily)